MNDLQIAQQLKSDLISLEWEEDGEHFFLDDSVHITLFQDFEEQTTWNNESGANIMVLESGPLAGKLDRQNIIEHQIELKLNVLASGGPDGELVVIGGLRGTGSEGRGLLEFKKELLRIFGNSFNQDGYSFQFLGSGNSRMVSNKPEGVGSISLFFKHIGTRDNTYEPIWRLRFSSATATDLIFRWKNPPRFDLYKIRMFRNSVKITSVDQASNIEYFFSELINESASVSKPSPGTYYYAVFSIYRDPETEVDIPSEAVNLRYVVS